MDQQSKIGPAAATVALTVVVAGAGIGACGDEVTTHGGEGGASTGTTSTDTSSTTTTVSTTSTTTTGHEHCDPACAGYSCPMAEELEAQGVLVGTTLTMTVDQGPYYWDMCFQGWASEPVVDVAPELGTLVSATTTGQGTVEIVIELTDGTTGGAVTVDIEPRVESASSCESSTTLNCPITRQFDVTFDAGGEPMISRGGDAGDPTLRHRPPMRLAFVEGMRTQAIIRVEGVPADLPLRFDVTAGQVQMDGTTALWQLPARAGWYQIQVVAERDGTLATDALMVEVRPS